MEKEANYAGISQDRVIGVFLFLSYVCDCETLPLWKLKAVKYFYHKLPREFISPVPEGLWLPKCDSKWTWGTWIFIFFELFCYCFLYQYSLSWQVRTRFFLSRYPWTSRKSRLLFHSWDMNFFRVEATWHLCKCKVARFIFTNIEKSVKKIKIPFII